MKVQRSMCIQSYFSFCVPAGGKAVGACNGKEGAQPYHQAASSPAVHLSSILYTRVFPANRPRIVTSEPAHVVCILKMSTTGSSESEATSPGAEAEGCCDGRSAGESEEEEEEEEVDDSSSDFDPEMVNHEVTIKCRRVSVFPAACNVQV